MCWRLVWRACLIGCRRSTGSFITPTEASFFDDGSWLGPDHPPSEPFSVRSGYARMRKAAKAFGGNPDVWFPVADMEDEVSWV